MRFDLIDPAKSHQKQKQDLFKKNNPSSRSIELGRNEVDLTNIRKTVLLVFSADFYLNSKT
jgi:hypothetical protein